MSTLLNSINSEINKSFKGIITDAKNASVSASKLIDLIKSNEDANKDFIYYLAALDITLQYEGKKSNISQIVQYFAAIDGKTFKASQFVAFLAKNCKDGKKLDGSSLLGAIKVVASVKNLELLVLDTKVS